MDTNDNASMTERFEALDYMTQRTIMNEFPQFFGIFKDEIDTKSIEHFPRVNMSKILDHVGYTCVVIAAILLTYIHFFM